MDLADFIKWGHRSAFTIHLSLENVLFVVVPFGFSFFPCWVGMEVQYYSRCDSANGKIPVLKEKDDKKIIR
jgi:hypothetical protein